MLPAKMHAMEKPQLLRQVALLHIHTNGIMEKPPNKQLNFAEVKLEYKLPGEVAELGMSEKFPYDPIPFKELDPMYRFASSVIMFGSILKSSQFVKDISWGDVLYNASEAANPTDANRTNTLTLVVIPTAGQGFASQASPNPASTTAGNPIDFRVTLSAPAAAQQVVTWRMTTAACFTQANTDAPYNAASPFQFFTFPTGQTSAIIRVRSVNNSGCTNKTSAVIHIFEAWVGDSRANPQVTAVTSGPTYTRTAIKLNAP